MGLDLCLMSNRMLENSVESMEITWVGNLNLRLISVKLILEIVQKRVLEGGKPRTDPLSCP